MKILVVCGAGYVSGLEIVTLDLIESLQKQGHDVRCVTSTWGNGDFVSRLETVSISYTRLPLGFISKTLSWSAIRMTLDQLWRISELWLGYWGYVRNFEPDVIIQSNFHHIFILWPVLNQKKTIFHVHNSFPNKKFYRYLFGFLNLKISYYVSVSNFVSKSLIGLGISNNKIYSILNSIKFDEKKISLPALEYAKHKNIYPHVRIGLVGQIGRWKGHDDLIEALNLVKKWKLSFSCIIFGQGESEYIEILKQKLEEYHLTSDVYWAGFVKDRKEIFSSFDICIVPSRVQEGFGMVAAEAAYFGIPVIATRRGGLPEIVQDGETGYLVDAESPMQIAEKLKLLIEDTDLRDKMGQTAHSYALQHFSQERMVQEMENIFLKVNN